MRISKSTLARLVNECIDEMLSESQSVLEASSLIPFRVYYQTKKGKEQSFTVKARNKDEAEQRAMAKLRGTPNFYRFLFAKQLEETTTTADVAGYNAPMTKKKIKRKLR